MQQMVLYDEIAEALINGLLCSLAGTEGNLCKCLELLGLRYCAEFLQFFRNVLDCDALCNVADEHTAVCLILRWCRLVLGCKHFAQNYLGQCIILTVKAALYVLFT